MKLKEIFDQLTHGEFRQLAIGGSALGAIEEANYPAIVAHVNLGLTALFTRFALKEGRVGLTPVDGQTTYSLDDRFAVNNRRSTEAVRYLVDSATDVYNDDVMMKVERVLDSHDIDQPLNVQGDENSFFTPSLKMLRIPADWKGDITLVYRQSHPQIVIPLGYFDPARVEIELPYAYLEALLYFVASRVHNPLGMQNEFNMGNNYAMKYEQACQLLERLNLEPDHSTSNYRLIRNGWV